MRALLLLPLVLLAGCPPPRSEPSNQYDQDTIEQHYEIVYDGEADETTAAVSFWSDGTRIGLSKPSYVTHNGTKLKYHKWDGDYRRTLPGLVDLHQWVWHDTRRLAYVNWIEMNPVAFVNPPERLSVSTPVALEFEPPLEEGERVTLDRTDGALFVLGNATDVGATELDPGSFWGAILDDYVGREVSLVLVRERFRDLDEATPAGGSLVAECRSAVLMIPVDP
jgi:hypothetical protein